MQHIMIDLETAGTAVNAPILTVGACFFDPDSGRIGDTFYEAIGWQSAFINGRASGDTMKWWMQQSDEARKAVIAGTLRTEDVLDHFRTFCRRAANPIVWGNGATFDISMLEYCYQKVEDRAAPWKFWNVRDCRTIKDLAGPDFVSKIVREGTHHQALDDAIYQAKWVSEMWMALRSGLKSEPADPFASPDYDPFA